ncbi:hypothetical protein AB3S75_025213 [Citrus x aurantiifolia]
MNSMFSAFSAEMLGQKVRAFFVSAAREGNTNMQDSTELLMMTYDGTCTMKKKQDEEAQAQSSPSSKNMNMTPRFALELDGLNCFETLVSF